MVEEETECSIAQAIEVRECKKEVVVVVGGCGSLYMREWRGESGGGVVGAGAGGPLR